MLLWLCIRLPQLAREALDALPQAAPAQIPAKDLPAQRAALERLAAWAYQWSSLVSYDPDEPLLWLELGASCALFEGSPPCSRGSRPSSRSSATAMPAP